MRIVALTVTKRPYMLPNVKRMLNSQVRQPNDWIVVIHGDKGSPIDLLHLENLPSDMTLGQVRNYGVACGIKICADVVAMIDDDDWYGPSYLLDLEESINSHPWGDIYGIREYQIGFVRERVDPDGNNIIDRRRCDGGVVLEGNRVTWVSGASVAVRCSSWLGKGLSYRKPTSFTPQTAPDGSVGGEDGGLWEECKAKDAVIIRRPSDSFCAIRVISEDGWGGKHSHTWGPLEYVPQRPAGKVYGNEKGGQDGRQQTAQEGIREVIGWLQEAEEALKDKGGEVTIAVRRLAVAEKVSLITLGSAIVQDESVPVGKVEIRLGTRVVRTIELGED